MGLGVAEIAIRAIILEAVFRRAFEVLFGCLHGAFWLPGRLFGLSFVLPLPTTYYHTTDDLLPDLAD